MSKEIPGWKGWAYGLIAALMLVVSNIGWTQIGLESSNAQEPSKSDVINGELDRLNSELEQLTKQEQQLKLRRKDINDEIQAAPELAEQLRNQMQRLEKVDRTRTIPDTRDDLDKAISLLDDQAKALQKSLSSVLEQIGVQQSLPSKAADDVQQAQRDEQAAREKLKQLKSNDNNAALQAVQSAVFEKQIVNAELRKNLAQNRLDGYQRLLDLYTVNRDLQLLQLDLIKSALKVLREKRDELRVSSADQNKSSLIEFSTHYTDIPKVLVRAQKENQKLNDLLVSVTEKLTNATDSLSDGKQELQEIRYRFELAKQQLEISGLYQSVDDYLLRQRQELQLKIREHENAKGQTEDISDARLQQFKLDEKLHLVRTDTSRRQLVEKEIKDSKIDSKFQQLASEDLYKIYSQRQETLNKLVQVNADYVVSLANLEILYEDQYSARQEYYDLLNRELFWRTSADPLDLKWFLQLPGSVNWFIEKHDWKEPLKIWYEVIVKPVIPLIVLIVGAVLIVLSRKRLSNRLERIAARIGNVTRDKFRYTLEAVLITYFMAFSGALLLAVLGAVLVQSQEASVVAHSLGNALLVIARWVFLFELVRQLCRENGLASAHFRWREHSVQVLKHYLPLLYLQLPWALVFIVVWQGGDDHQAGILGRACFILTLVFFLSFNAKLFSPKSGVFKHGEKGPENRFQLWNKAVYWVAIAVPVCLLVLSYLGFTFSAMELMILLFYSFMAGFLVLVLDQVLHRWFSVVERKLAYRRAIEKRDAQRKVKEQQDAIKSSGEAVPDIEMPKLDVSTISEQNRALLRVFSCSLYLLVCYWIWRDFLQAAQIFQEITLWSYSVDTDAGVETHRVALGTILITALVLALTYIGVKNLPGLIEVMILQRFHFDQGIRFAITSTARYLVILAGIMIASSQLGLDWSKLGWLVAALGVGLGFGLQEIFANFISGLIILYERPIRIGDTVTINNLSGTVYKINMRATTITDWDMKELIIPNKTFVTSQFINWTLSDTTTRLVIPVGIAYGSDTKMATDILLEIAKQHEEVLDDPAPSAFFLRFGASSLDLELRVFVSKFGSRLPLLHGINTEIDQRFKEAGIEIAFPQMDVHVRDLPAAASSSPHEREAGWQQDHEEGGEGNEKPN